MNETTLDLGHEESVVVGYTRHWEVLVWVKTNYAHHGLVHLNKREALQMAEEIRKRAEALPDEEGAPPPGAT